MKREEQKPISYKVEREFLAKVTVTDFVSRVIQAHLKNHGEKEDRPLGL